MIKDVFVFKKSSWHLKLMKFIWGYDHTNFRNMCPYFWLSVLNVFIVGPFSIVKGLGFILVNIIEFVEDKSRQYENHCNIKYDEWARQVKDQVIDAIKNNRSTPLTEDLFKSWKKGFKGNKRFSRLWNYHLSYSFRSEAEDKYYDNRWSDSYTKPYIPELKTIKIPESSTATQRIGKMMPVVKFFGKILGIFFSLIGIVVIGFVLRWLYIAATTRIDWYKVGVYTLCSIIALIAAVTLIVLLHLLGKLLKKISCSCARCYERQQAIGKFLIVILKGMLWPIQKAWKGLVTFWQILMAIKADNCPGLEWQD